MSKLELRGAIAFLIDTINNGKSCIQTAQGDWIEAVPVEVLQGVINQITEEAGLE